MSNKTILFADDSATMRTIMEKTFLAEPYDVFVVPSGEAAIMKAREIEPDIIIADAGMAGVSGYDVCKAIRDDASLATTPFIIMAGATHPYDESRGQEVGVDEYVKKPFDSSQLIERVGALISEKSPKKEGEAAVSEEAEAPIDLSAPAQSKPLIRPLTERPIVAPAGPRPIATPIAQPPSKDTMEFGRAPATYKITPEAARRAEGPALPEDAAEGGSFQVSTLAELAQKSEKGIPIKPAARHDAIELPAMERIPDIPSALAGSARDGALNKRGSAPSLPIVKAVRDRAHVAAQEIEEQVDGLKAEQIEALRVLTVDVIERVVWEIVPDLAEAIIKEELAKLLEE